jgi:hypothetical protein
MGEPLCRSQAEGVERILGAILILQWRRDGRAS